MSGKFLSELVYGKKAEDKPKGIGKGSAEHAKGGGGGGTSDDASATAAREQLEAEAHELASRLNDEVAVIEDVAEPFAFIITVDPAYVTALHNRDGKQADKEKVAAEMIPGVYACIGRNVDNSLVYRKSAEGASSVFAFRNLLAHHEQGTQANFEMGDWVFCDSFDYDVMRQRRKHEVACKVTEIFGWSDRELSFPCSIYVPANKNAINASFVCTPLVQWMESKLERLMHGGDTDVAADGGVEHADLDAEADDFDDADDDGKG